MSQAKPPRLLEGVYKIVCMGDSITQAGDPNGYVAMIRNKLKELYPAQNIAVLNAGISGEKAPDMLRRWTRDILEKDPGLVTLSVGINDVWHGFAGHPNGDGPNGVDLPTYTRDVTTMVDSALEHHIKMVLVSPTVITEDAENIQNRKLQGYVDAERKIAQEHRIPFVELHRMFLDRLAKLRTPNDSALHLTVDGVHMRPPGDRLMAYGILRTMGVPDSDLTDLEPGG